MTVRLAGASPFGHLLRLADGVGVLEHARGAVPRRDCGYCLDDNARALLVVLAEPQPEPDVAVLGERSLAFVLDAMDESGTFRNRLSYSRRWEDEPGLGDWWGRAVWALGSAAVRHPRQAVRTAASSAFAAAVRHRAPFPRSMAFAGLGAAEVLGGDDPPGGAKELLLDAVACIEPGIGSGAWPWPEPRLTYANAALPEALVAAGDALGDDRVLRRGLDLLAWLLDAESRDGHLSPTPVGGRGPGEPRPGFDQQPIEAGVMAGACGRAYDVTGDDFWLEGVDRAVGWFLGRNDTGVALYDPESGGSCDGLLPAGRNANQGAESTIALIASLQQARRSGLLV